MFCISPTDNNWFSNLRKEKVVDDINFWTPTPWNLKFNEGDRWYFMLKSPIRKIGGGGYIKEYHNLTVEQAWNKYGVKNGFYSKGDFIKSLGKHKSKNSLDRNELEGSTIIGCIILRGAVFLNDDQYIDLEDYKEINFSPNIVKYKRFNDDKDFLLEGVLKGNIYNNDSDFEPLEPDTKKKKVISEIIRREGQSEFKAALVEIYSGQCCITGESTPELLEAAHIQPYLSSKSNHLQNGLLLRTDIHKLFDKNLLFIDRSYKVRISSYVKSLDYQHLNGRAISMPKNHEFYPSLSALELKRADFRD